MTNVFALKVDPTRASKIYQDLRAGEARFGWSYCKTADLHRLRDLINDGRDSELSDEEWDCYQSFLLDIRPGDHVVYINVPEWGRCTTARVTKEYYWRFDDDDFNHRIGVDKDSVFDFDRNDSAVHPNLSARLKLQGRWWRIYAGDEFSSLIEAATEERRLSHRLSQLRLRRLRHSIFTMSC